jgi:hypothetical protein
VTTDLRRSIEYTQRGVRLVRAHLGFYLLTTFVYAAPAVAAAMLALRRPDLEAHEVSLLVILPWVTALLGTTVIMIAISAHARGETISLARATWLGITWLPRYGWTNAHTTPIFWVPISVGLATLQALASTYGPVAWVLLVPLALMAVLIHVRTLLAPFFAVHGDLPATRAAWTAWVASARNYTVCLVTFVLAAAPVALVLAVGVGIYFAVDPVGVAQAFGLATGEMTAAGIQIVRPMLIGSLYFLYHDIEARLPAGGYSLPWPLRPLASLTTPFPHLGRT